ncbi:oxidoreductase [Sphingomonas sp. Root710]|uniref:SDR family NAD(P)-dependent oxidoreductase n=1 Tax=Sphingomonas sp. Root710 TaxID=1736594 RepID=UPI0006FA11DC|nr:SDR family NAD(P)-dependent oxidoreductase [Sphingomonas sp. Root710]KRB86507.1 oxidoreductase [Sphingomonas sp. Root710]
MAGRLAGKTCIITGTGGAMGSEAALVFAREGALVIGCDVDADAAQQTLERVRAEGGRMESLHPLDLSTQENAAALAAFALSHGGRIDVLYNNGGGVRMAWLPDMSAEDWSFTIRNELDIIFFAVRAVWPTMVEHGGGSIINVGSVSGKIAYKVLPAVAHSAAKGGVIAMSKHMAMEGGPHGIRVNSISPGLVLTPSTERKMSDPAWAEAMIGKIMLARAGTPADVVPAAVYLASDEARWVTGADFAIDGGTTAW